MPYRYIEQYYGRKFKAGDRVTFDHDGRTGTVKRVQGDPAHVRVKFDAGGEGWCHPSDVSVQ